MNELKRLQRQNVNSKLAKLDKLEKEKGKAAAIFNVKDQIIGSKKENDVPSVVKDPKTNELIFHPSGIKKASVQYCKNLLTNREPLEAFKKDLEWKERVHHVRMNEELLGASAGLNPKLVECTVYSVQGYLVNQKIVPYLYSIHNVPYRT